MIIEGGHKLSSNELHIMSRAEIRPLRRVNGGWLCHDGDWVMKKTADSLMRKGVMDLLHQGKGGPFLVLTAKGRMALGCKMKKTA